MVSEDILVRIRKNKAYRKYLLFLDRVERLDVRSLMSEAKGLHAGRTSRTLYTASINPKSLSEAVLKDVAFRSRLVELRVQLADVRDRLSSFIKAVSKYLNHRYGDKLGLRSQASRKIYFDTILREGVGKLDDLDSALSILDFYIKDIDQTGFGLKNAVAVLQLIYKPENRV